VQNPEYTFIYCMVTDVRNGQEDYKEALRDQCDTCNDDSGRWTSRRRTKGGIGKVSHLVVLPLALCHLWANVSSVSVPDQTVACTHSRIRVLFSVAPVEDVRH